MRSAANILKRVGGRISERRLATNLSQAELGKRAGVSRDTVFRAERGENIGSESLVRLAIALDAADEFATLFPKPDTRTLDDILAEQKQPKRQRAGRAMPGRFA